MQKQAVTHVTLSIAIACIAASWLPQKGIAGEEAEPWETPRGDARVDCAVFKTKRESWFAATDRVLDSSDALSELRKEGISSYSDEGRKAESKIDQAESERVIATYQYEASTINAAKHLNYSRSALRDMWEHRTFSPKWEALNRQRGMFGVLLSKMPPAMEVNKFCNFVLGK